MALFSNDTQQDSRIEYKRVSEPIWIHYKKSGHSYFEWNGSRYFLSQVTVLEYPVIFYSVTDKKYVALTAGHLKLDNNDLLLSFNDNLQLVVLWERVK